MGKKRQARKKARQERKQARKDRRAERKMFKKGVISFDEYKKGFSDSDIAKMAIDQEEKQYQREKEAERQAQEMELKRQQMELQALSSGASPEQVASVVGGESSSGWKKYFLYIVLSALGLGFLLTNKRK